MKMNRWDAVRATRMAPAGNSTTRDPRASLQGHRLHANHRTVTEEDHRQTRRDLRVAIIFGIMAASLELGVLIYFFR